MTCRFGRHHGLTVIFCLFVAAPSPRAAAGAERLTLEELVAQRQALYRQRAELLDQWQTEKERLAAREAAAAAEQARLEARHQAAREAAAAAEERAAAAAAYLDALDAQLAAIGRWIDTDRQRRLEQGGAILTTALPRFAAAAPDDTPPVNALGTYLDLLDKAAVLAGDSDLRGDRVEIAGRVHEVVVLRVGLAIEYAVGMRDDVCAWRDHDGAWHPLPPAWATPLRQAVHAGRRQSLALLPVPAGAVGREAR